MFIISFTLPIACAQTTNQSETSNPPKNGTAYFTPEQISEIKKVVQDEITSEVKDQLVEYAKGKLINWIENNCGCKIKSDTGEGGGTSGGSSSSDMLVTAGFASGMIGAGFGITGTALGVSKKKGDPGEKGEKGDKGDKGETGTQGKPGNDGSPGAPGSRGKQGSPGKNGLSASDSEMKDLREMIRRILEQNELLQKEIKKIREEIDELKSKEKDGKEVEGQKNDKLVQNTKKQTDGERKAENEYLEQAYLKLLREKRERKKSTELTNNESEKISDEDKKDKN